MGASPTGVTDPRCGSAGESGLSFHLNQNFPNPFNPSTRISFTLPAPAHTTLKVYNVLGQRIATILDEQRPAGSFAVDFAPDNAANGVYVVELIAGSRRELKRMILLK